MPRPLFSQLLNLKLPLRQGYNLMLTSATGTLTSVNEVTIADSTAGTITLTLPAANLNAGRQLIVVKSVAANNVVVQRAGADTIGYGATTSLTLAAQNDKTLLISDGGSVWLRII